MMKRPLRRCGGVGEEGIAGGKKGKQMGEYDGPKVLRIKEKTEY